MILFIDYHYVEKISKFALFHGYYSPGHGDYFRVGRLSGARRWLPIGPFWVFNHRNLQKYHSSFFLADFLNKNREKLDYFFYFLIPFVYTGLFILLVFMQPDLGTSLVYMAILVIMLFVVGVKIKFLATIFSQPFRLSRFCGYFKGISKRRIILFINPNIDPLGGGYNVIQSKIAIGSGGLLGKGLFGGLQSQLLFFTGSAYSILFFSCRRRIRFSGDFFFY